MNVVLSPNIKFQTTNFLSNTQLQRQAVSTENIYDSRMTIANCSLVSLVKLTQYKTFCYYIPVVLFEKKSL